jgi:hypothetical protein
MPSKCVEALDNAPGTGDTFFVCPLNKVRRLTGIQIAEASGNAGKLTVTDTFTPSVSNGVAVPVETVVVKKVIYVEASKTYSWTDETKSIKILGTCKVFNSDANDKEVTVMWE